MFLVVDQGNTQVKWALFNGYSIERQGVLSSIGALKKNMPIGAKKIILSNVRDENEVDFGIPSISLSELKKIPFQLDYDTPETLGTDRLANAAAAQHYFKESSLIIDCGTCLTISYLKNGEVFYGGSISPGYQMRLNAMHSFTGKLPELKGFDDDLNWCPAKDTKSSLHHGAFFGMLHEIEGEISRYQQENSSLNIILTGGDALVFEKHMKSDIFADPNFTLKGLNVLLHWYIKTL